MKVNRHEMLEIFNFSESFLPAFMQYQQGEGPRPSPKVIIAVGQDFHPEVEPYSDLLLSVTVCHGQASHLLAQVIASDNTLNACNYSFEIQIPLFIVSLKHHG